VPFLQSSLGIDLREDRVILSHLRKSLRQIWITTSDIFPLTPSKTKDERDVELINTLQEYISQHGISKDNVVLGLPREKGLVKLVEIPSAAKENLRKVLEYELGKHIPFPPEEASFDYQVLDTKEGFLRVLLVVMKKEEVNDYLELFKKMGIRPIAVEISSTASANLYHFDQYPTTRTSCVLLDIGRHFCEFHFFEKGNLKEVFHFSFTQEEEKAGELAEAYRLALLREFGPKDGKESIFAYGEEAKDGLINTLEQKLSSPITLAQSLKRIYIGDASQKIAECYTAIGLALRGLSKTKWNINLLPLDLRKKVSRVGIYLAIFLSVAALVLAGTWTVHPFLQEREELDRIAAEMKEKKPMVDAIEAIQKKKGLLEKEVREFGTLRTEEMSRLDILKELSEILPATVWIWNMKLKSKEVEINGFADSASDLIVIIDKSPIFEKVEFSSPVTKERRLFGDKLDKERFRISAKIERAK
jgi:Tfp pilus assembly protein PilN